MPNDPTPALLTVEVHDVSPATWEDVQRLLGALDDLDLSAPTLLVVPRHEAPAGRAWDLREHPRLVEALQGRVGAGAEIVQHGLTHRAPGPPPRGAWPWFMHHVFSRGQAEFAHLGWVEATDRLREGRRVLAACGLDAPGFIAPAWQQSRGAFQAVADAGFAFTAFLGRVVPLGGQRVELATPALTFCAPGPLVDHGKRLAMRALEAWAHAAPLLRVALHPEDARVPGRLAHITARLRRLADARRAVRYADWLAARPRAPLATRGPVDAAVAGRLVVEGVP